MVVYGYHGHVPPDRTPSMNEAVTHPIPVRVQREGNATPIDTPLEYRNGWGFIVLGEMERKYLPSILARMPGYEEDLSSRFIAIPSGSIPIYCSQEWAIALMNAIHEVAEEAAHHAVSRVNDYTSVKHAIEMVWWVQRSYTS